MEIAALSTELASAKIQQQVQVKIAKGANESAEAVAMKLIEGIALTMAPLPDVGCKLNVVA